MSLKYKGWVPSVLGNLSFKLLGHSGYPYPFISSVKESDSKKLKLCCIQRRIPADYQLPIPIPHKYYLKLCSLIARKLKKENIESIFVMLAEGKQDKNTKTVQIIEGKIYLLIEKNYKKQKEILNQLENWEDKASNDLKAYLDEHSLFISKISLDRQGICTLTAINADDSEYSGEYEKDLNTIKALIDQCFYFIKDAFHSHKHHNNSEDTLISTAKIESETNSRWSDNVIKSLYRYIIRQRPLFNKSSLGIFCYIRTFMEVIKKKSASSESQLLLDRTVALEELEKSITHEIEHRESELTFRRWLVGITFVAFQMLIFYWYKLYEKEFSCFLKEYSEFIISLMAVIFFIIILYTKNTHPDRWSFTIRINNLLISVFEKKRNLLIFLGLISSFSIYSLFSEILNGVDITSILKELIIKIVSLI